MIDQFQRTRVYVKSRQLRYELCGIEKGGCTIAQYLGRIQQTADILKSIGDSVSHHDQLETILDGLPTEYQGLASIIQYRDEPCALTVAETMLLSHEARLERAPQTPVQEPLSVNLVQGTTATTPGSTLTSRCSIPNAFS